MYWTCQGRTNCSCSRPSNGAQHVLTFDSFFAGECVIVDPAFRSQFEVAGLAASGRYTSQLVPLLPHLFVGMLSTLASIVQLMDSALVEEAQARGLELPPWRSAGAMLSKWMPKRYSDEVRRYVGHRVPGAHWAGSSLDDYGAMPQ